METRTVKINLKGCIETLNYYNEDLDTKNKLNRFFENADESLKNKCFNYIFNHKLVKSDKKLEGYFKTFTK